MQGVGPPLVTPFDEDGTLDESRLRSLVEWVETRGVDFIVPCGSNSETPKLTADERVRVIETVAETASVPVLAGTGTPGRHRTIRASERAQAAGADGVLVVTPFYYAHDQATLETYYRELADRLALPVYLYTVPKYTGTGLAPDTVERLADHPNVAGMKDSTGDVGAFVRNRRRTADASFDLLVGSGSVLAQALNAGGDGGVLALANVAPAAASAVYETARDDPDEARDRGAELVELNTAVTAEFGIPGLKYAMRQRGAPAGYTRSPHASLDDDARERLDELIEPL